MPTTYMPSSAGVKPAATLPLAEPEAQTSLIESTSPIHRTYDHELDGDENWDFIQTARANTAVANPIRVIPWGRMEMSRPPSQQQLMRENSTLAMEAMDNATAVEPAVPEPLSEQFANLGKATLILFMKLGGLK